MKLKADEFKDDVFDYFTEERPWGRFQNLANNKACTVKMLTVKKGEALSLQRHKNRDQLYLLIDDGFSIYNDHKYQDCKKGEMFGFKRGDIHRAEYAGEEKEGRYIEVSFGDYDEEDIERIEDLYDRT